MKSSERARLHVEVRGAVQGVGFRPFVFRLAEELDLAGWVLNDNRGVILEVEGSQPSLEDFRTRIEQERPAPAVVQAVEARWMAPRAERGFRIVASEGQAATDLEACPS